MSRFFTDRLSSLEAYVPGEQPKDMKYIKLNTNESPFQPSPSVIAAVSEEAGRLQLYSDPECTPLIAKFAEVYGIEKDRVIMTNGSDEVLNFEVSGENIQAVHMLPGYTHNIINLSETENLVTVMWANEAFDPAKPDTYFEVVE